MGLVGWLVSVVSGNGNVQQPAGNFQKKTCSRLKTPFIFCKIQAVSYNVLHTNYDWTFIIYKISNTAIN